MKSGSPNLLEPSGSVQGLIYLILKPRLLRRGTKTFKKLRSTSKFLAPERQHEALSIMRTYRY
jgi:hypothetical protein